MAIDIYLHIDGIKDELTASGHTAERTELFPNRPV